MAVEVSRRSSEEVKLFDFIDQKLGKIGDLSREDIFKLSESILQLVQMNPFNAQALFNVILFKLERETTANARANLVNIINKVVIGESHIEEKASHFLEIVQRNIVVISHSMDFGRGQVRKYLHAKIDDWIAAGIVSCDFLASLKQAEQQWRFERPRPEYAELATESPSTFDLVVVGLQGPALDSTVDMMELIRRGVAAGLQEGWLGFDENGHYIIKDPMDEFKPCISSNCSYGSPITATALINLKESGDRIVLFHC